MIEGVRDKYRYNDIAGLLANPIRQAIISKAGNIFYIPDIHRAAITGGLVCELYLKGISYKKLSEILSDLQWIFSNYIFQQYRLVKMNLVLALDLLILKSFIRKKVFLKVLRKV